MIELQSLREKLSWRTLVFVALYIVIAVLIITIYLPARNEAASLAQQIVDMNNNEQTLQRVVAQKPQLEAQISQIESNIVTLTKDIPTQYDLPDVLEWISVIGSYYGVQFDSLEHAPIQLGNLGNRGVIPLVMTLQGSQEVFPYLLHIDEAFPSLKIDQVALGYMGDELFNLEIRANLHVFVADRAPAREFEIEETAQAKVTTILPTRSFGLPFETVSQFLTNKVKVLGIVNGRQHHVALITKNGKSQWLEVGDKLDNAVVRDISANTVLLDLDGIDLQLIMGG